PELEGIHCGHDDNGNRPGRILRCYGSGRRNRCDDVDLEPHQVGREGRQPVETTLRESILDDDVLTFDPTMLAQPFAELLDESQAAGRRTSSEIANSIDLACLLRVDAERFHRESNGDEPDESSSVDHCNPIARGG